MIGLVAYLFDGVNWNEAGAVLTNLVGSPVLSATPLYDGRAIADDYGLTFKNVVPGVSAKVLVACQSPANPYVNGAGVTVNLDGVTAYPDVVPGVSLVFSGSGTFSNTWQAVVDVGLSAGLAASFPPGAGTPSAPIQVRVANTGSAAASSCKARLLTSARRRKKVGTVFAVLRTPAPGATEKDSSGQVVPYSLAVSNVSGSGSLKVMDLKADGSSFTVQNLSTLATLSSANGSGALDVIDFYLVTSGPLAGAQFQLSQAAVNGDNENVLVFSSQFVQVAPDSSGAPGDFGVSDVTLTDSAGVAGVIGAGGLAYFWVRFLVPAGGNSKSNPYTSDVELEGLVDPSAGWGN